MYILRSLHESSLILTKRQARMEGISARSKSPTDPRASCTGERKSPKRTNSYFRKKSDRGAPTFGNLSGYRHLEKFMLARIAINIVIPKQIRAPYCVQMSPRSSIPMMKNCRLAYQPVQLMVEGCVIIIR